MFIGFGVLGKSKVEAKYSTQQVPMGENLPQKLMQWV